MKREDLFVTTKISDTLHKPEDVQWGLEDSLKKLGLEYVDLALVHWPIALVKEDEADNNSGFKKDGDGEVSVFVFVLDRTRGDRVENVVFVLFLGFGIWLFVLMLHWS